MAKEPEEIGDDWGKWIKFSHDDPSAEEIDAARAGVLKAIADVGASATPDADGMPDAESAARIEELRAMLDDEDALKKLAREARD